MRMKDSIENDWDSIKAHESSPENLCKFEDKIYIHPHHSHRYHLIFNLKSYFCDSVSDEVIHIIKYISIIKYMLRRVLEDVEVTLFET